MIDDEHCYIAAKSRDARFDGTFFIAVTTTRIYCRPSCPAVGAKREHLVFYPSAAAAQQAGFRACKRCRPDASPGSAEWNLRQDVVARAMRLIGDGTVDRVGVSGLAEKLGYSSRQLNRLMVAELGAGPLALARAQRSQSARILLETTELPISAVAFGAGFSSIRQFNDTVRAVFASSPSELREKSASRRHREHLVEGHVRLRLAYRPPLAARELFSFHAARAVAGIEEWTGESFSRVLTLSHGNAVAKLSETTVERAGSGYVALDLFVEDLRDLSSAVGRCRAMLDLDADPTAVAEHLSSDALLGRLYPAAAGVRVPGHVDGHEVAFRAVVGQQVSLAGARKVLGRLVERYGKPLSAPVGNLTHAFPDADTLAGADPEQLPMPRARARALVALAEALASKRLVLDAGADRAEAEHKLLEIAGIGPWTASYVAMRALRDADAFLPSDLGLRHALLRLGERANEAHVRSIAEAWRPYRAYALVALWSILATAPPKGEPTPSLRQRKGASRATS